MHCCFSGLEIIHGTVIYVIIQPIERKSKKSGDMKIFHPFLALILFIFVPKCSCKVNILQHTVDDVKMPKTNFLHTTYFSENILVECFSTNRVLIIIVAFIGLNISPELLCTPQKCETLMSTQCGGLCAMISLTNLESICVHSDVS